MDRECSILNRVPCPICHNDQHGTESRCLRYALPTTTHQGKLQLSRVNATQRPRRANCVPGSPGDGGDGPRPCRPTDDRHRYPRCPTHRGLGTQGQAISRRPGRRSAGKGAAVLQRL